MIKIFHLTALLFLLITCRASAQTTDVLRQKIQQIVSARKAVVGVSSMGNNGAKVGQTMARRPTYRATHLYFPTHKICKKSV